MTTTDDVSQRVSHQTATVSLHALLCGHFTLPEYQFIHPVSRDARKTVPSLAFLIQHHHPETGKITRIVFDLGLRRDTTRYPEPIQKHIETRQPMATDPDVVKSLARGGLTPEDVDYVIYSHVHWDHIGEPRDFPTSTFVVGYGSHALLDGSSASLRGGHSFFEQDLLPEGRTIELANPVTNTQLEPHPPSSAQGPPPGTLSFDRPWRPHQYFSSELPHILDLFGDGTIHIIDAPGHLPGHLNIWMHTSDGRHVYLAGDACHDRRILTGEKSFGQWKDEQGEMCCIHADRDAAENTILAIRRVQSMEVEVILAHDAEWEEKNRDRFFAA